MAATPKYPSNIKKYSGSIRENKRNGYSTFSVRVEAVSPVINKTFPTREEAETFVRSVNIDNDLCKNKMLEYDEYFEVQLTQGKWTKIDKEDLVHIEPHMFFYNNDDSAGTRIGGKFKRLPHILLNYEPKKGFVVTHKNGDNLDNRKSNLEITPLEILRKRQGHSKKSGGIKGVCLEETWSSVWMENGKLKSKNFHVGKYGSEKAKAMAAEHRKNIEKAHPEYAEALKYREDSDSDSEENVAVERLPTNVKKYTGIVKERPGVNSASFCVTIRTKDYNINKTFNTRGKAEDFLKKKNIEFNLPIKNRILEFKKYMKVYIGKNFWTKIDKETLNLVDSHIFSYSGGYATCSVDGKRQRLHRLVFKGTLSEGETVDHINVDALDNRAKNLRAASMHVQNTNKKISAKNSSGVIGVVFESCWVAKWKENGKSRRKSFSVKKYGFEEAKALATKLRLLKEETLEEYGDAVSQE